MFPIPAFSPPQSIRFNGITTVQTCQVIGGNYCVLIHCANYGSGVPFEMLLADGSTYFTLATFTDDSGSYTGLLAPATLQIDPTGADDPVYFTLTRIPGF